MEITHLEGNSAIKLCAKSIFLGIFHLDTYFIYEIHKSRNIVKINITQFQVLNKSEIIIFSSRILRLLAQPKLSFWNQNYIYCNA
jgi:hypothetical protein